MKVLVTGHRGYIGVHLVELLMKQGILVTGCDINYFDGCAFEPFDQPHVEWLKDFRTITVDDLAGFDCVMHLAAISNDPMGDLDVLLTYSINREGSIELARKAKQAGVKKFLFSSSCSIYGKGEKLDLDETAVLNPVSAYAESKIAAEEAIRPLADKSFCPVYLRNATAYGYSPMLRIDLVANNLLAGAFARGEIRVKSDGTPWRPLIHCRDIARAFVAFLKAPAEGVRNLAVNIGSNDQNFQVKEIVEIVSQLVPAANVVFTGEVGADPRNYRVNFNRLKQLFPNFQMEYTLAEGLKDLYGKFQEKSFGVTDFDGPQFVRLRTLKKKLAFKKEKAVGQITPTDKLLRGKQAFELEETSCDLCGSKETRVYLSQVKELYVGLDAFFDVVQCKVCGLKFVNPRPTPLTMKYFYPDTSGYYLPQELQSAEPNSFRKKILKSILANHYGYPFKADLPKSITALLRLCFRKKLCLQFLPRYVKNGKLLDVGCSWGAYLSRMKNLGWAVSGIEMNEKAGIYAREKFGITKIHDGLLEDLEIEKESFDVVNMSMVLEHVFSPKRFLRKVYDILKPGGQLIVTTPDISGFEAKVFGRYFYGIQVPQHLYHFTPRTLREVLEKADFFVEKIVHHRFDRDIVGSASYLPNQMLFKIVKNKIVRKTVVWLIINFLSLIGKSSRITVYARKM